MHDVQPHITSRGVEEGFRNGGKDLEPERLPQCDRAGVRLDHGVELHCAAALGASPDERVFSELAADAPASALRVDREAGVGYVRGGAVLVRMKCCRTRD